MRNTIAACTLLATVLLATVAGRNADAAMTFAPSGPYPVEAGTELQYAAPDADRLIVCRPVLQPGQWDGPRPAVLLIHGGGWDGGTPAIGGGDYTGYSGSWCRLAASWGFNVFSVVYRLQDHSAAHAWPAQLVDAQAAVRYVRAHATELDVDPRMIAAWGDSAGGSIALQLGTTNRIIAGDLATDNAGVSPQAQAVVAAFAPWSWGPRSPAAPAPEAAALLATQAGSGVAPAGIQIIQGTKDTIVHPEQSDLAYCFFKAHGWPVHHLSYPGTHEYGGMPGPGWMNLVGGLQLRAISFLFAYGRTMGDGATPVIPAGVPGPGLPFDDAAPPACG